MIIGWILLGSFVLCGGGCGAIIMLGATTSTVEQTTTGTAGPLATVASTVPAAAPLPTDFTIEVIELSRTCYGSTVGCSVSYQLQPTYIGATPLTGAYEVLYEVTGANGQKSDSFTVRGASFSGLSERFVSVAEGAVLVATPTRVIDA